MREKMSEKMREREGTQSHSGAREIQFDNLVGSGKGEGKRKREIWNELMGNESLLLILFFDFAETQTRS